MADKRKMPELAERIWIRCTGSLLLVVLPVLLISRQMQPAGVFSSCAAILLLLLLWYLFCRSSLRQFKLEEELTREKLSGMQQDILYQVQHEETEFTWKELKNLRHDYTNRLICIREYLKKSEIETALAYVNQSLQKCKGGYGRQKISNSFVDTFLGYKIRKEQDNHIQIQGNILVPEEMLFDETDLCMILGILFDSAVAAVRKLPEEERSICINMEYRKHTLKIGMEHRSNSSIKHDSQDIETITAIIRKYRGMLDIGSEKGISTVKALLYEKD